MPCRPCLNSCNNGHLFIFQSSAIYAQGRTNVSGEIKLLIDFFSTLSDEVNVCVSDFIMGEPAFCTLEDPKLLNMIFETS